jgi:RNA polymerase sigma-70 factor (ECF subfamily)
VDDGDVKDDIDRFTVLYDRYRMRVGAYAASRAGGEAADETVSETFMVAWRRFADMPSAELPWLLGVARNVMRDAVRAEARRASLTAELRRWTGEPAADVAEGVIDRPAMLRALADLPDTDREVLTLIAWHGPVRIGFGEERARPAKFGQLVQVWCPHRSAVGSPDVPSSSRSFLRAR